MFGEEFSEISIGELARLANMAPSAIRYYESIGLLESERTEGGQRRYGPRAVTAMRSIAFARSAGFTLNEIATLHSPLDSGGPIFQRWKDLAEQKLAELDLVIEQAQEMKRRLRMGLSCACTESDDCPLLRV